MSDYQFDYYDLPFRLSLLISIFPVTNWIFGMLIRFNEGKPVAGLVRFFFGWNIIAVMDLLSFCVRRKIVRLINA